MVFPDARTLIAFVRRAERTGRGDLVEKIAGAGLAMFDDGSIGFLYRTAA